MEERILARIEASQPRRWLGIVGLGGLGSLLLYIAMATPPAVIGWRLFLLAVGFSFLFLGHKMWLATRSALILTETELRDSAGVVLARIDEIEKVDRGMFSMKPSNGFNLFLKTPGARAWRPGLWWRLGRRVAVGGVTSGSQTKPVADILSLKVAQRDRPDL